MIVGSFRVVKETGGNLAKQAAQIMGGGGGGRPDFASAGGKDASRIDDAISAATATVDTVLGS